MHIYEIQASMKTSFHINLILISRWHSRPHNWFYKECESVGSSERKSIDQSDNPVNVSLGDKTIKTVECSLRKAVGMW